MPRPSSRCVLRDFKLNEVIHKVFNKDIIGQCISADDYTLLVTPGTQTLHDSVNEGNKEL
jgi:hypothetical protein